MKPKFEKHICVGDTIKWDEGKYSFVAEILEDDVTKVGHFDCYCDTQDTERWERGDWRYVGIVISVFAEDIKILSNAAAMWGIECNFSASGNEGITELAYELAAQCTPKVKKRVAEMKLILGNCDAPPNRLLRTPPKHIPQPTASSSSVCKCKR